MPLPDARTRLALLLGEPVAHSLSPLIHNTAFRALGLNAAYLAARVAPEALGEAVAGLRALGMMGANVTIPHKRTVRPYLDGLTPEADAIGAANTITRLDDGTLHGDNTDAAGFLSGLDASAMRGTDALVFGSGGAARAVVYALLTALRPTSLTIAARTTDRAEALAESFVRFDERGALRVVPLAEAPVRRSRLVVNATPLGMHPDVEATVWPNADDFGPDHTVYDLVYAPAETRLLREAAQRGASTIDGLAMLIGQAAAAFEQWTGQAMPADAVRAALRHHLNPLSPNGVSASTPPSPLVMPVPLLRPSIFSESPGVAAAFSTRAGGVSRAPFDALNVGYTTGDDEAAVRENRRRLLDALGFDEDVLATVGQVHGTDVARVTEPGHTEQHDALVTDRRGLVLGVPVADCGAVLLADAAAGVVGACHAGWRGTVGGIPIETVEEMQKLGAVPRRIRAYVSPCIGPDDFEVGPEVAAQFDEAHVRRSPAWAKPHVDLPGAIVAQLVEAGLDRAHIEVDGCSTFDTERFFSYRAEAGTTGRMMGLIGLREAA